MNVTDRLAADRQTLSREHLQLTSRNLLLEGSVYWWRRMTQISCIINLLAVVVITVVALFPIINCAPG